MEHHLEAVATRRGPVDSAVDDAYDAVAEAFERYEEALDVEFAEALPLVLEDTDEDFDDDSDDDNDVLTLDDEEIDPHAVEDEDELDDDIEEFELR